MKILTNTLKYWLPLAAAVTVIFVFIEVTVQQNFRMSANDPQIQMAEDAAARLAKAQPAEFAGELRQLVNADPVDMAVSLAPYLIIYDANGQPVAAGVSLHGTTPPLPAGIFDYTRQNGEDRVSWQPEHGVRSAAVVVAVNGGKDGFVLAGRSLREVEVRESNLNKLVGIGWLVAVGAVLFLIVMLELIPQFSSAMNRTM